MPIKFYLFCATRWEIHPSIYFIPNTHVIITGIGAQRTSRALRQWAEKEKSVPPDSSFLLSVGFSGATHKSLHSYDIVLANQVRWITYETGWHTKKELCFPEENLLPSYHGRQFKDSRIVWGQIGTVSRPVFLPHSKKKLGESCAICSVDMESFVIAQWAQERHLPFLAIRIILDNVEEPLFGWKPLEFPRRVFKARDLLGEFLREFLPKQQNTKNK